MASLSRRDFRAPVIKAARSATDAYFDAHLMIDPQMACWQRFAAAGVQGITVHAKSVRIWTDLSLIASWAAGRVWR